jgi:hypothetical protein
MGCLVAFIGALVGMLIGIGLTFALLLGENADALSWLAVFVVFGGVGGLLGTTAALVWRDVRKRRKFRQALQATDGGGITDGAGDGRRT